MVSSTTSPMAKTIPRRVNTLIENPNMYIMKKVPMREIGMVITGITVVLQSRKKAKMITTTSAKAIMMVC